MCARYSVAACRVRLVGSEALFAKNRPEEVDILGKWLHNKETCACCTLVGFCSEHAANPWKFLRNCVREFFGDNVKSFPSLPCIKGPKSENVAILTKSKLLLYNFMIV